MYHPLEENYTLAKDIMCHVYLKLLHQKGLWEEVNILKTQTDCKIIFDHQIKHSIFSFAAWANKGN